MTVYFFDTSAIQYRYLPGPKARSIRRICSDGRNVCHIAELTILEIASALGKRYRGQTITLREHRRAERAFWEDIRSGRLCVRPTQKKDILRARHLMAYAGVDLRRNITSVDALIAATAVECALETNARVALCLEDRGLYNAIKDIPVYRSALRFRYIGK